MTEPIHIISLGAGVQSSTMALMAAKGEITPIPTAAIFADTQSESKAVYEWLDFLEKQLPFPVHRVTRGNLTEQLFKVRERKDGSGLWSKQMLPVFILNADGTKGITQRQCTYSYKIEPLDKAARKLGAVKRGEKEVRVIKWIGISTDEAFRMKESRFPWQQHRWPLIELGISRQQCLAWMRKNGFPQPPKSSCIYCPFHSDAQWRALTKEEFAFAVDVEKKLQAARARCDRSRGVPFLHASLKPLDQVDFSTEEERGQLNLFNNECEGMCGV